MEDHEPPNHTPLIKNPPNKQKARWGREEEKGRDNWKAKSSTRTNKERWVVLEFWVWDLGKLIEAGNLPFSVSSWRGNSLQTTYSNMIWEAYGSQNGLNFYLAFLAPPRSLFPPHSLPKEGLHPRSGISRSSDRRALCFAHLQTGCRNHCSTLLLPTLESPHPWAAEVRYATWLAAGRPRYRVRRPGEQSEVSPCDPHPGTSSRGLVHPSYRRSIYWVSGLTRQTAHLTECSEGLLNILQMNHKEASRTVDESI